jgi:hypothetical protein
MLRAGASAAAQIFLSRFALGSVALALSFLFSSSLAAIFLSRGVFSKSVGPIPQRTQVRSAAVAYAKYPMFMTVGSVAGGMTGVVENYVVSSLYSRTALGWQSLAGKLLAFPMGIIAGACGPVYVRRLSRAKPGEKRRLFLRVTDGDVPDFRLRRGRLAGGVGVYPRAFRRVVQPTGMILRANAPVFCHRICRQPDHDDRRRAGAAENDYALADFPVGSGPDFSLGGRASGALDAQLHTAQRRAARGACLGFSLALLRLASEGRARNAAQRRAAARLEREF